MTASIIEHLMVAPKTHVAYVICTHDNPRSLEARTIIGSIVRQVLEPLRSQLSEHTFMEPSALKSIDDVRNLLKWYVPSPAWQEIMIAIDGLEECTEPEVLIVLSWIQHLRHSLPSRGAIFKFYISSRPEFLKLLPAGMKPDSSLSMVDGSSELAEYIENTLEELRLQGKLRVGNPQIMTNIRDALEQGAQGMFLWLHLQMTELCSRRSDRSMLEALRDLPRNLPETFDRILQKISDYSGENASLCKSAFSIIFAAMAPLTLEALREALSVEPRNIDWDPSTLINDIQSLIDCTGGLLIVDEEARTVHFVHHSFRHYLTQERFTLSSTLIPYYIHTPGASSLLLDRICLTYLNFSMFSQQIVRAKAEKTIEGLGPAAIIESSIQRPGLMSKLARTYMKGRPKQDLDVFQALRKITVREKSTEHLNPGFGAFLHYTRKYWCCHCPDALG